MESKFEKNLKNKYKLSDYIIFFDIDWTLIKWWYNLDNKNTLEKYVKDNKEEINKFKKSIIFFYKNWVNIWISTWRSINDSIQIVNYYFPKKIKKNIKIIWECWTIYLINKEKTYFLENNEFLKEVEMIKNIKNEIEELWWKFEKWKEIIISINSKNWEKIDLFLEKLKKILPKLNYTNLVTSSTAIDFLPKNIDKYNTIKLINKENKKLIYFWDSWNDLTSILNSYISIIPKNWTEEVKKQAKKKKNYIISNKKEIIWVNIWLEKIIDIYKK